MNENEKEFLKFYMEQSWEEMRHIENLRERVTILVITVASAIFGFIMQHKFTIETKPFVWFVILLGVFGLLMTLKLFQIHQMAQNRLDMWYLYLESHCGNDTQILKLRRQADNENKKQFFYIARLPHNYFWSAIHIFIVFVGFYLFSMYHNSLNNAMKPSFSKEHIKKDVFSKENQIDSTTINSHNHGK
jgi:uncharacterized membrane protein YjfL (UPF0719 family)